MILVVGGEKGGVGKTTLATHLAVMQKGRERTVVLVDADPQGTASTWADARKERDVLRLPCLSLRGGKVHVELQELAQHYEDVVLDTGGADSQEFRSALLAADTLLLPLRPGSFDRANSASVSPGIGGLARSAASACRSAGRSNRPSRRRTATSGPGPNHSS